MSHLVQFCFANSTRQRQWNKSNTDVPAEIAMANIPKHFRSKCQPITLACLLDSSNESHCIWKRCLTSQVINRRIGSRESGFGRKQSWSITTCRPDISLEAMNRTMKTFSQEKSGTRSIFEFWIAYRYLPHCRCIKPHFLSPTSMTPHKLEQKIRSNINVTLVSSPMYSDTAGDCKKAEGSDGYEQ